MGKGTKVNTADEKMFKAMERGDHHGPKFKDRNPGKLEENPLVKQKAEHEKAVKEKTARLKELRLAKEAQEAESKKK